MFSQQDVEEQICKILMEVLSAEDGDLDDDTKLKDLGAESIDTIDIACQLCRSFDIKIAREEYLRLSTVGSTIALVQEKLQAKVTKNR